MSHRLARDLAPDGVEAAQHHRAGCVVYQHRHARQRLERADVPAFAANDAALQFVPGQRDGGGGGFVRVLRGVALDGDGNDAARGVLGLALRLGEDAAGKLVGVAERGDFTIFEQLRAGIFGGELGDAGELFAALARVERGLLGLDVLLALEEAFELRGDERLALGKALLGGGDFLLARDVGQLGLTTQLDGLLVRGHTRLAEEGLGLALRCL